MKKELIEVKVFVKSNSSRTHMSLSRTDYFTYLRSDHVLVGLVYRVYKRCAYDLEVGHGDRDTVTRVHVDLVSNMCFFVFNNTYFYINVYSCVSCVRPSQS